MEPIYIKDGDGNIINIDISTISGVCKGTMDDCEKYCPNQSSCQTFALANDLLKERNGE